MIVRWSAGVLGTWACLLVHSAGALQSQGGTTDASAAAQASAFTQQLRDRTRAPGLAVAVVARGRMVASEHVGWADVDGRVAVSSDSRFRVGSLSKLFTATAALRLADRGVLDLDAPITRYLSDVPSDKSSITARQLATHLSGFGHYGQNDYVNTAHFADAADTLPALLARPLAGPPGAKYAYSSYGYNVLGIVIQRAAGKPFPTVLADEVFGPLGMTHSGVESDPNESGRVKLYSRAADGTLAPAAISDLTDRWPSGGCLSTAEDLARFGDGVLRETFLRERTREMAFTSQRDAGGNETRVGIGWRIARDEHGRRYVHHGGDSLGGRAFLLVYPSERVSVAMVANVSFAAIKEADAVTLAGFVLP